MLVRMPSRKSFTTLWGHKEQQRAFWARRRAHDVEHDSAKQGRFASSCEVVHYRHRACNVLENELLTVGRRRQGVAELLPAPTWPQKLIPHCAEHWGLRLAQTHPRRESQQVFRHNVITCRVLTKEERSKRVGVQRRLFQGHPQGLVEEAVRVHISQVDGHNLHARAEAGCIQGGLDSNLLLRQDC